MNNVRRFPRPFGITQMMVEYHNSKDDTLLQRIKKLLINQWLINNGSLSGIPYTINKLAVLLHVDLAEIRLVMRDQMLNAKIWDNQSQKEILQAVMGEQLSWVMEDRMQASQQLDLLMESQGNSYKPFVSAEVNKAMKLKLDTTNNLQQVIRALTGGNTTNITIDNSETNVQQNNNITIEEARLLVIETNQELSRDKSSELKLLETQYDIHSLPEVVATKQSGVDTSKEGLSFNNTELNLIADDYKGAMAESTNVHHQMRREIEERIDPESPDPELDIYDDLLSDTRDSFNAEQYILPS